MMSDAIQDAVLLLCLRRDDDNPLAVDDRSSGIMPILCADETDHMITPSPLLTPPLPTPLFADDDDDDDDDASTPLPLFDPSRPISPDIMPDSPPPVVHLLSDDDVYDAAGKDSDCDDDYVAIHQQLVPMSDTQHRDFSQQTTASTSTTSTTSTTGAIDYDQPILLPPPVLTLPSVPTTAVIEAVNEVEKLSHDVNAMRELTVLYFEKSAYHAGNDMMRRSGDLKKVFEFAKHRKTVQAAMSYIDGALARRNTPRKSWPKSIISSRYNRNATSATSTQDQSQPPVVRIRDDDDDDNANLPPGKRAPQAIVAEAAPFNFQSQSQLEQYYVKHKIVTHLPSYATIDFDAYCLFRDKKLFPGIMLGPRCSIEHTNVEALAAWIQRIQHNMRFYMPHTCEQATRAGTSTFKNLLAQQAKKHPHATCITQLEHTWRTLYGVMLDAVVQRRGTDTDLSGTFIYWAFFVWACLEVSKQHASVRE
jgi:hypothetical protein